MLKKLGGLSRNAIGKARSLLPGGTLSASSPESTTVNNHKARVIAAADRDFTRRSISRSALRVLEKLHHAGHGAYLVGGGVRDALIGLKPKDFDVATDASPETVRELFRNSRIIGRRFRLVHVVFGREIIEVATFRAAHDKGEGGETGAAGRIVRDNVFGSIEEDAWRRDFSVNALYYNIADDTVIDYVGGLDDLDQGLFRLIGDPMVRCAEDPVRVLRAARLSAKLRFAIEPKTLAAMRATAHELKVMPPARLFDEVLKLFQGGYAQHSFNALREHDLLRYLFPLLDQRLKASQETSLQSMLDAALANTDKRVAQGKPITPSYLLAFMLWPDVEEQALMDSRNGMPVADALHLAAGTVLSRQLRVISIPRRFSGPMKAIWQMQPRLERLRGARALRLMEDRRFRAAYDFLCLRATIDERLIDSAQWWTTVQTLEPEAQEKAAVKRPTAEGIWASELGTPPPEDDEFSRRQGKKTTRRRGGASKKKSAQQRTEPKAASASEAVPVQDASAPASKKKRRRRRRRKPGSASGQPSPE